MRPRGNFAGIPRRRKPLSSHCGPHFGLMRGWRKTACANVPAALLLALWFIAPRSASCQTPEEQVELSFRAGQQALKQGEFAHAAEEFKKVLALDPNLVEAEVNLGLAYQSLSKFN